MLSPDTEPLLLEGKDDLWRERLSFMRVLLLRLLVHDTLQSSRKDSKM